MVQLSESDMQGDHTRWIRDYAVWLLDVEHWESCHDAAMVELQRLFVLVKALRYAARNHGETITAYADMCERHVQAIAGNGVAQATGEALAFSHGQVASKHKHVGEAHDKIQMHHDRLMASLRRLLDVIGEVPAHRRYGPDDTPCDVWDEAELTDVPRSCLTPGRDGGGS